MACGCREYIEQHGKPSAFYSDRHAVFHVSKRDAQTERLTQFGRVLNDLNIELICANSSQAKGRVERANKTLQDRLVKEMRLQGIDTMEFDQSSGQRYRPTRWHHSHSILSSNVGI